jgi:hypothetical protein
VISRCGQPTVVVVVRGAAQGQGSQRKEISMPGRTGKNALGKLTHK